MTTNRNQEAVGHGTDPGLANTVVRYRDAGEPGWYITTERGNGEAGATSGPYEVHELERTLRPIDGRGEDDDHETDLTPEENAIEEGHVARIESEAVKVAETRSTTKVEELQSRKDRLAALMTAANDYDEWCAD